MLVHIEGTLDVHLESWHQPTLFMGMPWRGPSKQYVGMTSGLWATSAWQPQAVALRSHAVGSKIVGKPSKKSRTHPAVTGGPAPVVCFEFTTS